jgi:hypothetical protein
MRQPKAYVRLTATRRSSGSRARTDEELRPLEEALPRRSLLQLANDGQAEQLSVLVSQTQHLRKHRELAVDIDTAVGQAVVPHRQRDSAAVLPAFQGLSQGRTPSSRSAMMRLVMRVEMSARCVVVEVFIVLLLSSWVTSRKKRAGAPSS